MSRHTSFYVSEPLYDRGAGIIHDLDAPDSRGRLAMKILDHFALISAQEDGEDASGRQKLKLLSPREVAARACDLADAFYTEIEDRGWLMKLPTYEEIQKVAADRAEERKNKR